MIQVDTEKAHFPGKIKRSCAVTALTIMKMLEKDINDDREVKEINNHGKLTRGT